MSLLTKAEAEHAYGYPVNGHWAQESQWITSYPLPAGISMTYAGKPVNHIVCHKDMVHPLSQAFANAIARGCAQELKTYGGCFAIRAVRGTSSSISWHSWGLAVDLNPESNPLASHGHWSANFVKCFKDAGFIWGGDFHSRKDPMHFQWGIG
jgi:hypothetical protein